MVRPVSQGSLRQDTRPGFAVIAFVLFCMIATLLLLTVAASKRRSSKLSSGRNTARLVDDEAIEVDLYESGEDEDEDGKLG